MIRKEADAILMQSQRRGWQPSPKQLEIMKRLRRELLVFDDCDLNPIEYE